jgi:hypothetical protein
MFLLKLKLASDAWQATWNCSSWPSSVARRDGGLITPGAGGPVGRRRYMGQHRQPGNRRAVLFLCARDTADPTRPTCVADEEVQRPAGARPVAHELAHTCKAGEVELAELYTRAAAAWQRLHCRKRLRCGAHVGAVEHRGQGRPSWRHATAARQYYCLHAHAGSAGVPCGTCG